MTEAALSTSTPPRLIRLADGQEEVRGDEGARVYHVQRGDTLWDLAERFLGAGVRWRELRDLNIGRPQHDGETLQPGEDVYPGWTLILPDTAHAVAQTAATQTAQPSAAPTVVVERGDTLWDLADEHLGDPFRWPYIYQRNRGKPQPDGRQLTDPDLIHPGWLLHLPEVEIHSDQSQPAPPAQTRAPGGPATAEPPPPDPHTIHVLEPLTPTPNPDAVPAVPSPGPLRADSSPPADPIADTAQGGENALAPSPGVDETDISLQELAAITSAAALVAGLVLTLDRLRRARLRRRQPGYRIPLPDRTDTAVETRQRALADPDTVAFVDLALRQLAAGCDVNLPPVVVVSYSSDDLAVHLATPHTEPPESWEAHDNGLTWVLPRPPDLANLTKCRGTPSRHPALVTLGTARGGRPTLLNLAHVGTLHLNGSPQAVIQLLTAWALELATTPRADALEILTLGLVDLPADLERLQPLTSADELRARLEILGPAEVTSPSTTVILVADLTPQLADAIRNAAEQRHDIVAAIAGPPQSPNASSFHLEGETGRLQPENLTVRLLELSRDDLAAVTRLLDQAKHDPDLPIPLPELPDEEPPATQPAKWPAVEVRILGPVEIAGAESFKTNKTIELIVYLAMHRAGVDTDTLLEALWPDQSPRAARLYTEASRARKALGTAHDSPPYLPDAELGRYRLSEQVALDYDQFTAHAAAARGDPQQAEQHLRDALTLVRGVPLSLTATEYAWAHEHALRIAQEIADTAHRLAKLYLGQQRYEDAGVGRRTGPRRRSPRRDSHPRPHGGRCRDRQHRPRARHHDPPTPPTRRRRRQQRRR